MIRIRTSNGNKDRQISMALFSNDTIEDILRSNYEQGDPLFDGCDGFPFASGDIEAIRLEAEDALAGDDGFWNAIYSAIDAAASKRL